MRVPADRTQATGPRHQMVGIVRAAQEAGILAVELAGADGRGAVAMVAGELPDGRLRVVSRRKSTRAAEPPYRQIANWLRGRIEGGEFRPEIDPLPSEKELGETFEVARETVRRAVAVLRDEGLVRTVPQRGTYVIDRK